MKGRAGPGLVSRVILATTTSGYTVVVLVLTGHYIYFVYFLLDTNIFIRRQVIRLNYLQSAGTIWILNIPASHSLVETKYPNKLFAFFSLHLISSIRCNTTTVTAGLEKYSKINREGHDQPTPQVRNETNNSLNFLMMVWQCQVKYVNSNLDFPEPNNRKTRKKLIAGWTLISVMFNVLLVFIF